MKATVKPKIDSTYYSDGTRQMTVWWQSPEGERDTLFELRELVNEYFAKRTAPHPMKEEQ